MKLENVKQVGVVGVGTVGRTIVPAVAVKWPVIAMRGNVAKTKEAHEAVLKNFPALVKRKVITEEEQAVCQKRITMATDLSAFKDCQVIIEAVPDDVKLKNQVLSDLNKIVSPETVFATTSSAISVTGLGAASGRPDRFIGSHFCIPAHLMALVEVAPGLQTSKETFDFYFEFLRAMGKTPIKVPDRPGFIVNYLLFPFVISAVKLMEAGLASPQEIDTCCKLGLGHAMGPFELLDMTDLRNWLAPYGAPYMIFQALQDDRFFAPPILNKMSEAGWYGRASGKGFYDYTKK